MPLPQWIIVGLRSLVILGALFALELMVRLEWINPLFLARPTSWVGAFRALMAEGELPKLAWITLSEIGLTFLVGGAAGLLLGTLLYRFRRVGEASSSLLGAMFASPIVLLYPIFLVIFGRNRMAIMAQAMVTGIIPIILQTRNSFLHVNETLIDVGRVLNLTRRQMFFHIMLPAAAPMIFTGIRLGLIYMLLSIIAIEYIVGVGGLG
ncbi:MAG: ABC transporter permease subunit, partial [Deltaproteobacteria bacterium]|nr:ABC transporter permease subunit [Deltaproteobacteria bacterium]